MSTPFPHYTLHSLLGAFKLVTGFPPKLATLRRVSCQLSPLEPARTTPTPRVSRSVAMNRIWKIATLLRKPMARHKEGSSQNMGCQPDTFVKSGTCPHFPCHSHNFNTHVYVLNTTISYPMHDPFLYTHIFTLLFYIAACHPRHISLIICNLRSTMDSSFTSPWLIPLAMACMLANKNTPQSTPFPCRLLV